MNMKWKEELLIKLDKMGIAGRIFNWFHGFLFDRSIQVRVGSSYSKPYFIQGDFKKVLLNCWQYMCEPS